MSAPLDKLSEHARDQLRQEPQPEWINPMLATLVHEPFNDPPRTARRRIPARAPASYQ